MIIERLCYELYKLDWMRRISPERQASTMRDWYLDNREDPLCDTEDFRSHIKENGYDGEGFVCYREFLEAEFLDQDYVENFLLASNPELVQEYRNCRKIGRYVEPDETEMVAMTVFKDSTDLYSQDEIEEDNLAVLDFPLEVVKKYFEATTEDGDFDLWLETYTADETEGLFDFAKKHNWHAKRAA